MPSFTPHRINPRYATHLLQCDVLVAGGGPAGVCAAISAARSGAKVVLCHDRPMLGGNASSEIRMHIVGANAKREGKDLILEPRETGLIEEIRLENAVRNPQRSPSVADLILFEKCRDEANLTLLLNTTVHDAEVQDGTVTRAHAVRHSTEDVFLIDARVYVDCTGDGSLGASAGAEFVHGREGRAAFDESLASEQSDRHTLGSTLLFMAKRHEHPVPFVAPKWARRFTKEDFQKRGTFLSDGCQRYEYGYWWLEWGGMLDTVKDNEVIRDELLSIVMGVWDYIKNHGDHGADHWALDWFGVVPGKRESRRFIGQYVLSEKDVMEAREFPDGIAYGGWPIDIHPPGGIDEREAVPCVQTEVPHLYEIPLRACVSRNIQNLMFAGRNLSATHVAFASTRVMATCAVVGEGVGVAAAVASRRELTPSALAENPEPMREIRQHLVGQDVFVIGERNEDARDKAPRAAIFASSERESGPAANVVSGQNRAVGGSRGVRAERLLPGTHRWISEASLPAWIELRWPEPEEIRCVRLTFDTGLHRHLTLTHSDRYHRRMCWGAGQPETVKDFSLQIETSAGWETVEEIHGNWKRHYERPFSEPLLTRALRVVVTAAWGIDHARIIQIAVH